MKNAMKTLALVFIFLMPTFAFGDFYRFIEINQSHGSELWAFYVDLKAGEHATLTALLTTQPGNSYMLSEFTISETEVDIRTTNTAMTVMYNQSSKVSSFVMPDPGWYPDPFAEGAPWTIVPFTPEEESEPDLE